MGRGNCALLYSSICLSSWSASRPQNLTWKGVNMPNWVWVWAEPQTILVHFKLTFLSIGFAFWVFFIIVRVRLKSIVQFCDAVHYFFYNFRSTNLPFPVNEDVQWCAYTQLSAVTVFGVSTVANAHNQCLFSMDKPIYTDVFVVRSAAATLLRLESANSTWWAVALVRRDSKISTVFALEIPRCRFYRGFRLETRSPNKFRRDLLALSKRFIHRVYQ